jgi:hypothetical protein
VNWGGILGESFHGMPLLGFPAPPAKEAARRSGPDFISPEAADRVSPDPADDAPGAGGTAVRAVSRGAGVFSASEAPADWASTG